MKGHRIVKGADGRWQYVPETASDEEVAERRRNATANMMLRVVAAEKRAGVNRSDADEFVGKLLRKGDRVTVATDNGDENGTIESVTRGADFPRATVLFADATSCSFGIDKIRRVSR